MSDSTALPMSECPYCGGIPHQYVGQCPSVKAVEYDEQGRVRRVEKFNPAPWPYGEAWKIPEITVTGNNFYPLSGGKPFDLP